MRRAVAAILSVLRGARLPRVADVVQAGQEL